MTTEQQREKYTHQRRKAAIAWFISRYIHKTSARTWMRRVHKIDPNYSRDTERKLRTTQRRQHQQYDLEFRPVNNYCIEVVPVNANAAWARGMLHISPTSGSIRYESLPRIDMFEGLDTIKGKQDA